MIFSEALQTAGVRGHVSILTNLISLQSVHKETLSTAKQVCSQMVFSDLCRKKQITVKRKSNSKLDSVTSNFQVLDLLSLSTLVWIQITSRILLLETKSDHYIGIFCFFRGTFKGCLFVNWSELLFTWENVWFRSRVRFRNNLGF